jgi:hypothetical protein
MRLRLSEQFPHGVVGEAVEEVDRGPLQGLYEHHIRHDITGHNPSPRNSCEWISGAKGQLL